MSELPPEIWSQIFDFALFVPAALDFVYGDLFETPSTFWNTPFQSEDNSAVLSRAVDKANLFALQLMLVSRYWHDVAIRKFYRHLRIRSYRHLERLIHRLASPCPVASPNSEAYPLGLLVRRLDLVMQDVPFSNREEVFPVLDKVFVLIPNLQILELSATWHANRNERAYRSLSLPHPRLTFGLSQWNKIALSCGPSLRRIQFAPGHLRLEGTLDWDPRNLVRFFPNLRTISTDGDIWPVSSCWLCHAASSSNSPPLFLDSITLRDPKFMFGLMSDFRCSVDHSQQTPGPVLFPNLSSISIAGRFLTAHDSLVTIQFLQLYGPQLNTVYLLGNLFEHRPERALPANLPILNQYCARLSTLVLRSNTLFNHRMDREEFPFLNERRLTLVRNIPSSVTRLAILVAETTSVFSMDFRRVVRWFATPEMTHTSIRVIRIVRMRINADIWSRSSVDSENLEGREPYDVSDQDSLEDSPEELFDWQSNMGHERFVGALRRLTAWGIRVEDSNGCRVRETD